jgi:hypothetical protein
VIWEAFKPESEPRRSRQTYASNRTEELLKALSRRNVTAVGGPEERVPRSETDFLQREGGIY